MSQPKLTLHHLNRSRAHRIVWLLEELGLTYEIKTYLRNKEHRAPPELTNLSPLGKAPVLEIEFPDQPSLMMAESGAIIEFLLDVFDKENKFGLSSDASIEDRYHYYYYLHMAEGTAMPPLLVQIIGKAVSKSMPFFLKPIGNGIQSTLHAKLVDPDITKMLALFQDQLSKTSYFAGEKFTAADIMMHYPVDCMNQTPGLKEHPAVAQWRERVYAREAWKKTVEKVGELDLEGFR